MTRPSRSPSPKISLVVSDVNGTLVTDQKMLTELTKAAVAALHRRGIIFSFISSRPPRGLRMVLDAFVAMFKQAGFGIVIGIAAPAVQRAADVVTASNREDGFAHATKRFIFGSAQSGAVVDITRAGARG
jgi:hydroxymethylpyrimidine pyrophosphatase-like HAD family hydrolase